MTALPVPNGKQQFTDALGVPLALGQVFFYIPGTTTFKNTWQDNLQAALNANPVQLDAAGRASIYGTGDYRQIVQNVLGVTIWDQVTSVTPDLSSISASTGAALVGWQQTGTGSTVRTVQSKLRDFVSILDFGADNTGTTDNTAIYAVALTAKDCLYFPPGIYLGSINLSNLSGKSILGAGRGTTTLKNFGATAVLTFDNSLASCQQNHVADIALINRDRIAYPNTDGIVVTGAEAFQSEFHVFSNMLVQQFRYGLNISGRFIWTSFNDVHFLSNVDGVHIATSYNVSQLGFKTCRFGSSSGNGVYMSKNANDAFNAIHFDTCTFELNALNGFRGTGTVGFAGLKFSACYAEQNALGITVGSTAPYKANIFIDSPLCIGLSIDGCCLFGTTATPIDWNIVVTSTTGAGILGTNRVGVATTGYANLVAGFLVGPRDGGNTAVTLAAGSYDLTQVVTQSSTTAVLTLTGCTTAPIGTARIGKSGNVITLQLPAITATSNATTATLTGLPAAYFPTVAQTVPCLVQDATLGAVVGTVTIDIAGGVTLFTNAGAGAFANTGTKGVKLQTITYSVN